MRKTGSISYASDKAIYDALLQRKFKNVDLRELFLDRGIFLSDETPREDVALYFSRLNHDYFDHQAIANALSVASRKERTGVAFIKGAVDMDMLEPLLQEVIEAQNHLGDYAELNINNKGFEIEISYAQVNYNKSEFRQVEQKKATLSFECVGNEVIIRGPHNDYINDIKSKIFDRLEEEVGASIEVEKIDLSDLKDPKTRIEFFDFLINNIDGLSRFDVSDVYVYHPEMEDEEDFPDSHIKKVSLNGKRVSDSAELGELFKKGFYTWKIRWQVFGGTAKPDRYELEAQFDDPVECVGFSYCVLGVYKHKEIGAQIGVDSYQSTRKNVDTLDNISISRKIENAARRAISEIRSRTLRNSEAIEGLLGGK